MDDNYKYDWLNKYRPKKIDQIICNKSAVLKLKNWLVSFENNKKIYGDSDKKKNSTAGLKSCVLITGSHGTGKSLAVETVLNEYNYEIQHIDFNNIKNGKNMKEIIQKTVNNNNIINLINNSNAKKTAIVIDEMESITSTNEKGCILTLQKLNDHNWFCPVIFLSNNQHNKLLSEIKKGSLEVKFFTPFEDDLKKVLAHICNKENIKIKNMAVVDKILEHSQSDIRRLINTLQDIKYAYTNCVITEDIIEEYCRMSKKKDVDIDLFKATEGLMYEYKSINDCLRLYETEKVLLPLMIHQNYAKTVIDNIKDEKTKYSIIKEISESLSKGDVIENYIYGEQNWDMQEIHGFYTCVEPSFKLHENLPDNYKKSSITFTTDLNKTSIKKINKKNINNTNRYFNDLTIFDYVYINKILKKLIDENNIDKCMELLKDYNIKIDSIESLLKIDKITTVKTNLSSKQKKEIQKYL